MTNRDIAAVVRVREAVAHAGGLVGAKQLGERWGVSRQRVHKLAADDETFPRPLYDGEVKLWVSLEVDAWRANR